MNNIFLVLPVDNLRNTATFFEGINLKVNYHYEKNYIEVFFNQSTHIRFVTKEVYERHFPDVDLKLLKKTIWLQITIEHVDEMDYLLNIIRLSGGEIIKDPYQVDEVYYSVFEDYNGYVYKFVTN